MKFTIDQEETINLSLGMNHNGHAYLKANNSIILWITPGGELSLTTQYKNDLEVLGFVVDHCNDSIAVIYDR